MQNKHAIDTLSTLPPEVLISIISFLPIKDKIKIALVSHLFRDLSRDNQVWLPVLEKGLHNRTIAECKRDNIKFFDGYKQYKTEENFVRRARNSSEDAKILVSIQINLDTQELELFRKDATLKYIPVDFRERNIYPLLRKVAHCKGFNNILNSLTAILDDPYCSRHIINVTLNSDKTGSRVFDASELYQVIEKIRPLAEDVPSDPSPNNSRCFIS